MKKTGCENMLTFDDPSEIFECGNCGNHVCKQKAELWGRICPNCFGRLYRIS